jgi:hypothetical protein
MQHEHSGSADLNKMPYCDRREQVKELFEKYQAFRKALPLEAWGNHQGLEYCAICGRPCYGHDHFDLENPGQIIKTISDPDNPVIAQYGVCKGGGRPELIARMLAIRAVLLKHKGDAEPNHAEIRKEAAFAADAAPLDPTLMARAKAIFAKEAKSRKFNNVGLNDDSSNGGPPGPPSGPGRRGNNDSDEKEPEEGDEGPVLEFVPYDKLANDILRELKLVYRGEGELPQPDPDISSDKELLFWVRSLRRWLEYTKFEQSIPVGWTPDALFPDLDEETSDIVISMIQQDIAELLQIDPILVPTPPEDEDSPLRWYEALREFLEVSPAGPDGRRYFPEGWSPEMQFPQRPAVVAAAPAAVANAQPDDVANMPPAPVNAQPDAPPQNWAAGLNPGNFQLNENMGGGRRRLTRGRRKSAIKKRLRTQRNSRR